MRNSGIWILFGVSFLYSLFAVFFRQVEPGFPFLFGSFVGRVILAIFFLGLVFLGTGWKKLTLQDSGIILTRGVIGVLAFLGDYFGSRNLSLSSHYFLVFTSLLVSSLLIAIIVFKEKITTNQILGSCFALIGVAFLLVTGIDLSIWMLASVIGGIAGALWQSLEKLISKKISTSQITALDFVIVGLTYLILSLVFQEKLIEFSLSPSWTAMIGIAVVIGAVGYGTVEGFKMVSVEQASLILMLQLPFTTLIGVLLYMEQLSLEIIVSGICVVIGTIISQLPPFSFHHIAHPKINRSRTHANH